MNSVKTRQQIETIDKSKRNLYPRTPKIKGGDCTKGKIREKRDRGTFVVQWHCTLTKKTYTIYRCNGGATAGKRTAKADRRC